MAEGDYSITFETDDRKAYEQVQSLCRLLVDGKDGDAIPIEWIEKKAQEFLINRNFRWATDFQEVVDMWKVENNIPLFDGELKITLEKENEII